MKKCKYFIVPLILCLIMITGCGQKKEENNNNTITTKNENWNLTSDMIEKMSDKIDFESYVLTSLYFLNSFDVNNIPNDMILRLGYSKISGNWNDDLTNGNIYQTDKGPYRKISASSLDKNIKDIFGNNIKYNHESFVAANYGLQKGLGGVAKLDYDADNKEYITDFNQGGGESLIAKQYIYGFEQKDNEVDIYANIYFSAYNYDIDGMDYYKDFDWEHSYYGGTLTEPSDCKESPILSENECMYYGEKGSNQISCTDVKDCTNDLHKYVYTFVKDGDNFYLKSFKKLS